MAGVRLIFLGAPGTGKGTQARRMSERFGLAALSSGDILRAEVRHGSAIGRKAEPFMVQGGLVPDEIITGVMLSGLDRLPPEQGFILDGFPRTVPQADALERGLAERGRPIDAVVDLSMADALIVARIGARRVCTKCDATYNIESLPPRAAGVCDRCGGRIEQRVDDRPETVSTRLATYRAQTAPLIEFYARRGLLRNVDASARPEAVEAAVAAIVTSLGRR